MAESEREQSMGAAAVPVDITVEPVGTATGLVGTAAGLKVTVVRPVNTACSASSELKMGTVVMFRLLGVAWRTQLLTGTVAVRLAGSTMGEVPIVIAHTIGSKAAVVAIELWAEVATAR